MSYDTLLRPSCQSPDLPLHNIFLLVHPELQLWPPLTVSLSSIATNITPVKSSNTVDDNIISSKYPHLSQALGDNDGYFDPADPTVVKLKKGLLQEINHLLRTNYQLNVQSLLSNKQISYVWVPRAKSDQSFLNLKEWLNNTINISGPGGAFESAYRITNHLIKFYKDSFLAACKAQNVPVIKPMSTTVFQTMLTAGKVTGTGERKLKKNLSSKLGKGFCPTRRSISMLSEGHSTVHYGCKQFTYDGKEKSETVQWMEKNIDNEIMIYLQRHLSSKSIDPCSVCRV